MAFRNLKTLFPTSIAIALAITVNAQLASAGVVRFDVTSTPLGFFGQQFAIDYATPYEDVENMQITKTRMHLEFNTTGAGGNLSDAANIAIDFQPPTVNLPILQVSGANFGWQGEGQFTTDFETDFLNEPILTLDNPTPGTLLLWFSRIINLDDNNPRLGGQFANSFIEVELAPIPEPATLTMLSVGLLAIVRHRRR